jgi:hypothetical protein
MGFMNLLCYLAIKTPLLDSDVILQKYSNTPIKNFFIRYLEYIDSLYDAIIDDIRTESFQVGEKY